MPLRALYSLFIGLEGVGGVVAPWIGHVGVTAVAVLHVLQSVLLLVASCVSSDQAPVVVVGLAEVHQVAAAAVVEVPAVVAVRVG
eukprot:2474336-Pyramimonas_sp.AAC.1